jgi:hypothetical protein
MMVEISYRHLRLNSRLGWMKASMRGAYDDNIANMPPLRIRQNNATAPRRPFPSPASNQRSAIIGWM